MDDSIPDPRKTNSTNRTRVICNTKTQVSRREQVVEVGVVVVILILARRQNAVRGHRTGSKQHCSGTIPY